MTFSFIQVVGTFYVNISDLKLPMVKFQQKHNQTYQSDEKGDERRGTERKTSSD